MADVILVGRGNEVAEIPASTWHEHLSRAHDAPSDRLAFMTPDHHRVRNFAVTQLPRQGGKPLSAEETAERLGVPLTTVQAILSDLQRHLFFVVLNSAGDVTWAFPVTVEKTRHRLRFSSGETVFAA